MSLSLQNSLIHLCIVINNHLKYRKEAQLATKAWLFLKLYVYTPADLIKKHNTHYITSYVNNEDILTVIWLWIVD